MAHLQLPDALDARLRKLVQSSLAPRAAVIDQQGIYPEEFMRALGRAGGFGLALPESEGGNELGLAAQVGVIALVAETCGSTAFLTWCQAACAWYLHQTARQEVRNRYLLPVARGELMAGTGMSNAVKHLAGIERINIRARREGGGFSVHGALPWVSNLGKGHLLIVAAELDEGGYIMFVVPPDLPGQTLRACPHFAGMEGTGTFNVHLKNAYIPAEDILAGPDEFEDYLRRIKPGFLLTQVGMALGLVRASVATIEASNRRLHHVNQYLEDGADALARALDDLWTRTSGLADQDVSARPLDVLRVRAKASELALRATQSAALHTGAAGYLMSHPAQRRLREALFVAIVTPALKHLRKEIAGLEQLEAA